MNSEDFSFEGYSYEQTIVASFLCCVSFCLEAPTSPDELRKRLQNIVAIVKQIADADSKVTPKDRELAVGMVEYLLRNVPDILGEALTKTSFFEEIWNDLDEWFPKGWKHPK